MLSNVGITLTSSLVSNSMLVRSSGSCWTTRRPLDSIFNELGGCEFRTMFRQICNIASVRRGLYDATERTDVKQLFFSFNMEALRCRLFKIDLDQKTYKNKEMIKFSQKILFIYQVIYSLISK